MPSLMKARSGVLNSNIGGNALAPLFSTGALTIANAITDVTRLAGVEGDGATYPASMAGVWPAATNLCANGGFETNTTGWGARGSPNGPSIARTTAESKFGGASLAVTIGTGYQPDWGAAFDNSSNYIAVTGGSTYTLSVWVKSNGSNTVTLRVFERDGAKATIGIPVNGAGSTSSGWVKLVLTATANASAAYWQIIVGVGSAADVSFTYYLDGVQLETGSIATPYIETDGGTASRVLGRWQSPANPRLNGNQGWIAVRFKCGGLGSYAPLIVLQNDTDSSSDNRVALDGDAAAGRYRVERKDAATAAVARLTVGDALVLGDDALVVARWSPTALGFAKGGGGAWVNTAATNVFNANNHHLDTRLRWSTTAGSYTTQYWVAAGDGVMPDDGRDLMHSWGNNDPLPHQFPRSWGLCELEHFNGDGTMYRYAA